MTLPFHPYAELFPLIEGEAFEELVADIRDNGLHDEIVMFGGQILDGRNRYRALCALAERGETCDGHALDGMALDPATSWLFVQFATRGIDGVFSPDVVERGPLAFVLSKNLRRRHLDEGQRGMVAAGIARLRPGRPPLPSSPTRGEGSPTPAADFAAEVEASADLEATETPPIGGVSTAEAAELLNVGTRTVERARVVLDQGAPELVDAARQGHVAVSAAAEIARLPVDEQRALIERMDPKAFAAVAKAKRAERQAEKKARRERREAELGSRQRALPERRYGVIYADPEWRYEPWDRGSGMDRAADNHYPTSSTEEIKARRVADIAADDCVLFLWATVPMLREGLEVLAAWGFEYRSNLVWHKRRAGAARGPGYWFTNEHEILLVGVKGEPPCPAPGKQWASLIAADVREHSVKPDEFVWLIEDYFPSLPKIELNARVAREGWDAWGLEAPAAEEPAPGAVGSGQWAVGEERNPQSPSNRELSAGGKASSSAAPQGEADHAGIGSETPADREGRIEGRHLGSEGFGPSGVTAGETAHNFAFRQTPDGEASVPELLPPGSIVRTSYGTGPYVVVRVHGPFGDDGPPHWSLQLCHVHQFNPKRPLAGDAWVNECVAVGGRVLKLLTANGDEVIRDGFDEAAAAAIGRAPAAALRGRFAIDGEDGSVTAAEWAVLQAKADGLPWRQSGEGCEAATVSWLPDGSFSTAERGQGEVQAAISLVREGGEVRVFAETHEGCGYVGSCMSIERVRKFLRAWGRAPEEPPALPTAHCPLPTAEDEPDIPTFLRRGHPDCAVRA